MTPDGLGRAPLSTFARFGVSCREGDPGGGGRNAKRRLLGDVPVAPLCPPITCDAPVEN